MFWPFARFIGKRHSTPLVTLEGRELPTQQPEIAIQRLDLFASCPDSVFLISGLESSTVWNELMLRMSRHSINYGSFQPCGFDGGVDRLAEQTLESMLTHLKSRLLDFRDRFEEWCPGENLHLQLVGHSFGTVLGSLLLANHAQWLFEERINVVGLHLMAPALFPKPWPLRLLLWLQRFSPRVVRLLCKLPWDISLKRFQQMEKREGHQPHASVLQIGLLPEYPREFVPELMRGMLRAREALVVRDRVQAPIWLYEGAHDVLFDPVPSEYWKTVLRGADRYTFRQSGHFVPTDHDMVEVCRALFDKFAKSPE